MHHWAAPDVRTFNCPEDCKFIFNQFKDQCVFCFPFSGVFFSKTHSNPLENPIVKRLAAKYGKSPAQILLRQLTQRGICVIPKSTNEKRLLENINVSFTQSTQLDAHI
jgi:hypothetical protein